jgi:hypothetical protein
MSNMQEYQKKLAARQTVMINGKQITIRIHELMIHSPETFFTKKAINDQLYKEAKEGHEHQYLITFNGEDDYNRGLFSLHIRSMLIGTRGVNLERTTMYINQQSESVNEILLWLLEVAKNENKNENKELNENNENNENNKEKNPFFLVLHSVRPLEDFSKIFEMLEYQIKLFDKESSEPMFMSLEGWFPDQKVYNARGRQDLQRQMEKRQIEIRQNVWDEMNPKKQNQPVQPLPTRPRMQR